jgi:SAM-dependent methyltransferase
MKELDKAFFALAKMHHDLEHAVSNELLSGDARMAHSRKGHYPHIPLNEERFILMMEAAEYVARYHLNRDPKRMLFLDVGCGIGTKLALARSYFGQIRGVEICKSYAEFANSKLLYGDKVEIIDGRDYAKYDEADVIYMYSPFANPALQVELEIAAYRGARMGTLFIECLKHNHDPRAEPFLQRLLGNGRSDGLFLKTRSKRLAADIAASLHANGYR